jgi:hypothetical protein
MELAGKAMSLRTLAGQQQLQQMQLQQAQQQQDQERTLADLYKGNINPDGTVNRQGLMGAAAQQGLGARIPGMQKQFADADKATADVGHVGAQTDELKFKVQKQKLDVAGGAINSLLSKPDVTHDDVISTVTGLVQQGIIDPNQGSQMVRTLPGNPAQLRQYLMQKGLEVMDASKRMDLLTPKFEKMDNGGAIQMGTVDQLTGQFTPGAALRKVQTPDSVASNATTMRGQNMTDARAREGNDIARQAARTQLVETPDGYVLVDKGTALARPASTMNGAQIQGKDSGLNDTQAKALLFGSRMQQAEQVLSKLDAQGVNRGSVIKQVAEGTPLIGGALGAAANSLVASPQQQQVEQAQRDFVNAVLRRESGAAISPSEFDSAKKQYFPQVGDSQAVIQQKAQNRQLATRGLMAEVPAKKRGSIVADTQITSPQIDFQMPADIQAILNKHGAK